MHIEGRCQFCPDRRTPLHATAAENATSVTIRHGRNRRSALCLLLAAAVAPAVVFSQSPAIPRIGFLGPGLLVEEFRKAIADLGYVEGRSVVIDVQWPDGDRLDLMTASANELLQRRADVLVVVGATAARAAKSATTTVPIVFEVVVDPVATGLVAALDKPGGNATGSTTFDPGFSARQIELLRSVLPETKRIAILGDTGAAPSLFEAVARAARSAGLDPAPVNVERGPNPDFDAAFRSAKAGGATAMLVLSTPVTTPNRKRIAELARKYMLPTISPRDHADGGGLVSFGTSFKVATRHSAGVVDRILKGAKPGDLPVEPVARHELVVNRATASALGIVVPDAVLKGAEVID